MNIPFYSSWKQRKDKRKRRQDRRREVIAKVETVCFDSTQTMKQFVGDITGRDEDVTIPS